jgi:hypothetical protein
VAGDHPVRIDQQGVVVHQAHTRERRGLDVLDRRADDVMEPAGGERLLQDREEIEVERDGNLEWREVDMDLGDFLEPDGVRAGPGDLVGDGAGPGREVGPLQCLDREREGGEIVVGRGRDEGADDGIHVGADVEVSGEDVDAPGPPGLRRSVGLGRGGRRLERALGAAGDDEGEQDEGTERAVHGRLLTVRVDRGS